METLTDKVARLTAEKETLEAQSPRNETLINSTSIALDEAKKELEQEQAAQVRIQTQEEKVESITLPHDFNKVFDDPRANDIIIELIKQYRRQANAEHNTEIASLVNGHREEIRAAGERELQLKRQNDELQIKLDSENRQAQLDAIEFTKLEQEIIQLKLERDEALKYRDAAVREKEGLELLVSEKDAHIQTLRDEIAVGASKAINVTAVEPTDKLSQLVKESAEAKANRALARWAEMVPEVVAPPTAPEAAVFPVTTNNTANNELDNSQASGVPADDQEVTFPVIPTAEAPQVPSLPATMAQGASSTDGQSGQTVEERFEALERRVAELEKVCNVNEAA